MEEITIMTDEKGGTAKLTTCSSLSHYGIPILRIEAEDISGDFGPADLIGDTEHGIFSCATVVAGWASEAKRSAEEKAFAVSFLRQWPDGPQIAA